MLPRKKDCKYVNIISLNFTFRNYFQLSIPETDTIGIFFGVTVKRKYKWTASQKGPINHNYTQPQQVGLHC